MLLPIEESINHIKLFYLFFLTNHNHIALPEIM